MDKCNEIKDLILTDYIDHQLDAISQEQIEKHLSECESCLAFSKEAKENLIVPFQKATVQEVPVHLWQNIRDDIQKEQTSKNNILDFVRDWVEGLSFPKLVPIMATCALMVFIGSQLVINHQVKQVKEEEQVIYIASMFTAAGSSVNVRTNDLGTPIEHYFL